MKHFRYRPRFHACSSANMSAAILVGFLANKSKFIPHEAWFATAASKICQH
ncbi:MAG: DUF2492 family protein [Candidatus Malihini olakiniferum]